MTTLSKSFLAIGCILILLAIVLRIASIPVAIPPRPVTNMSLLILANTALLLAVLFKK